MRNNRQVSCRYTGQHAYAFEVPLVLERFYLVASAVETIALNIVNARIREEK